jgi:hypothetical protein
MKDLERAGQADEIAKMLARSAGCWPATYGNNLIAREMVLRFRDLVFELMAAGATYSPNMSEADLRQWAADVVKTIRGE